MNILAPTDYKFMTIIWSNEPLTSRRLVELCADELGWKKPTTYTVLRKLCERGFAQNIDTIVTSLIPRESAELAASERFVDATFDGSLPKFLASFLSGKTITDKEADELKRMIDEHRG